MNTQRLITLIIGLNLILGWTLSIYHNINYAQDEQLTTEQRLLENYESSTGSNDSIWGSIDNENLIGESSIGNPITMGWNILQILINGLNPFSVTPGMFNTPLEKRVAELIVFFRSLLMALAIIQAYILFKNRGTN